MTSRPMWNPFSLSGCIPPGPGNVTLKIVRGCYTRFLSKRKSKLLPRSNGLFEIQGKIGLNAYKVDFLGKYGVFITFNVVEIL